MSDNHQKNYAKLRELNSKLKSRYLNTLATFRIYDRFKRLAAPNRVGKRNAEANVKIFSNFKYFFLPIQEATRCYFFIELAKFFDKQNKRNQTLTIDFVLDFAEKNISSFSTEEFIKFHKERKEFLEIFKTYKPLTVDDLTKIRRRIQAHKQIIKNLKDYRDKYLAHDDIEKIVVNITAHEIRVLLKIVKDTTDLLYRRLDFGHNIYDNFDKEPVYAVDRVVKNLQEYETERLRKLKEEYGF